MASDLKDVGVGLLLLAVLFVVFFSIGKRQPPPAEQVSIVDFGSTVTADGWLLVEGLIQNTGSETLTDMVATVRWYDESGREIASKAWPVPEKILKPGKQSRFSVGLEFSPVWHSYSVDFRASGKIVGEARTVRP
ncbi:MAG: hypothetical protein HY647_05105 [Acidobacteria bacterium]|nr:hypothetical protein [Acidobacteriota bacterium]